MTSAPYAELHASSAFSFLDGASLPEDLAQAAHAQGLSAMALVDAHGVYGAPRFYKAARALGLKAIVGAEVALDMDGPPGAAPPRLTLLAASRAGYKNLCRLLTHCAAGRPKGQARGGWGDVAAHAEGLYCLTGGDEGVLARAWGAGDDTAAAALGRLRDIFPDRLSVELQRHGRREQERRNQAFAALARDMNVPLLATNGVRQAAPRDKELQDVLTCIRHHTTLDRAGRLLAPNRERHVKSPAEMKALFTDLPEAVAAAHELAQRLDFTLADLGYRFPDCPLPPGETPASHLRKLTWEGAPQRFPEMTPAVRAQLEKELTLIEKLDLAGYFLIVHDIVQFCRREKIMVQGRGSAANSAVCFALAITAVDPVRMELLFERFLSEERGEWPDIDLDLPSGDQRERVIQYLYQRHGGRGAAMTANVITYRPRSALRDAAKAFGYSAEQADRAAKRAGGLHHDEIRRHPELVMKELALAGLDPSDARVKRLVDIWRRLMNLPRHLGQHSGGMVLTDGRLDEVVPLEPAAMAGRVVIQWDKDDCADLGIVKVDLLGLGMLALLEEALPLIEKYEGVTVDLAKLPPDDPAVYGMIRAADTIGVFQLESRAQMSSLPRHAPERFYDIVVQVAIIRPGPITGGMTKPFFERRRGLAPVTYLHPSLEPVLKRTLGIPIFQEQVIRMAMVTAGFTGGEAEELRRAMGFKRSEERMNGIEGRLRAGMAARGITGPARDQLVKLITSFATYGFPESHAASFALIAYASAYLKARHPEAFTTAILNAWPMGFYHPSTLVKDAQRHGVEVRPIDVGRSGWDCRLERGADDALAVRLGLKYVKGLSRGGAAALEREQGRPFTGLPDLSLRCGLKRHELLQLAHAGALSSLGLTRRAALWQAAKGAPSPGPLFQNVPTDDESPLREMTPEEETVADHETAQLTAGAHPLAHARERLRARDVLTVAELGALREGARVRVAGLPVVRQRPPTAQGFVFITLEDESGLVQATVRPDLFDRRRDIILGGGGLVVEGLLQKNGGNPSLRAIDVFPLASPLTVPSHDFH